VLVGCSNNNNPTDEDQEKVASEPIGISDEEKKKVDLYLTAMKAAYQEENGGDGFIAVKLDTLEGLSDKGKQIGIDDLKDISPNVYSFEDIKDDKEKFKSDEQSRLICTLDGSLLYISSVEYKGEKVIITAVSWFGNLGAVFPKYEAVYDDGHWQLNLLSMAIS